MAITIRAITLATTHTQQMVEFYNAVLDANLSEFQPIPDTSFYSGKLAGIPLTICPNTIAQVDAQQNRQQFEFAVDDIHDVFITALNNGGMQITAIEEQDTMLICSVYDPDGNSIVFSQAKSS
ncbi:MAG: VOC family protein [Chloroflexota bacterium]